MSHPVDYPGQKLGHSADPPLHSVAESDQNYRHELLDRSYAGAHGCDERHFQTRPPVSGIVYVEAFRQRFRSYPIEEDETHVGFEY